MIITKKQVLKAIDYEKLKPGNFMQKLVTEQEIVKGNKDCSMCAVGALLRNRKSVQKMTKAEYFDMCDELASGDITNGTVGAKKLLKEQNYIGALSSMFEGLCEEYGVSSNYSSPTKVPAKLRTELKKWVRNHFPDSFTVGNPQSTL